MAKVLVVDNQRHVRHNLFTLLWKKRIEAEVASGTKEALARLKKATFDLLLVDVAMSEVSGVELLRRVKDKYPDMDVIMTGYSSVDMGMKALKLGAYDFLQKPFDEDDLMGSIERCLEKRRLEKALKGAEESLREWQARFQTIYDTANVLIMAHDVAFRVFYMNPYACKILGYERGEMIGKEIWPILEYGEYGKGESARERGTVIPNMEVEGFDRAYLRKDGQCVVVNWSISALRDAEGNVIGVLDMGQDITERKQVSRELLEKQRLNQLLLDSLPHPAMLIRRDRTVLAANRMAYEVGARVEGYCWRGFGQSKFISKQDKNSTHDGTQCYFCLADQAMDSQKATGSSDVKAWNRVWDIHWVPLDDDVYLHYAIDVTDRKEAGEVLQCEHQQLLAIFDSIDQPIYISDPNTYEILYANKFVKDVFQKDVTGGICYEELQGLESPCEFCTNDIIMKGQGEPYKWEFHNPVLGIDSELVDKVIRWPDGRDVRLEFGINVTKYRRMDENMRGSEQRFRAIFDNASDGIFLTDLKTKQFLDANRMMCHMVGYTLEEMRGLSVMSIHPDEDLTYVVEKFENQVRGDYSRARDIRVKRKDGSIFFVDVNYSVLMLGGKSYLMGTFRDVTDRKQAEETLQELQAEREIAVFEERNRMSREIYDILAQGFTGITNYIESAERSLDKDIRISKRYINYARTLARESLNKSQRYLQDLCYSSLDRYSLADTLNKEVWKFEKETGIKAGLEVFGNAYVVPPDVEDALLGICMETLENVKKQACASEVEVNLAFEKDEVSVSIRDNGMGFNLEAPTTNAFDLVSMRERAQLLGGEFELQSESGRGTLVEINLPRPAESRGLYFGVPLSAD